MDKSKEFNAAITRNFFAALQRLKADKVIRGKATFAKRYEINRMNLAQLEKEPSRGIFQQSWLYYMVMDYKVEPMFLLTGTGAFYQPKWNAEKVKKLQTICKRETPTTKQTDNQFIAR